MTAQVIGRAALCALALTWGSAPAYAQQTDGSNPTLTSFAWPIPSAATVVETVFKGGQESKTRYRLTMTRRPGGGIRVRYSDFEFLEVSGADATTPEMKEALKSATALAAAIPDLHVRADGAFEAATGIDEVIDKVVEFLAESRGWSQEQQAGVRANMQESGMADSLRTAVGQYWRCWAGAWIGWSVPPGETKTERRELPVLGATTTADVTLRNRGKGPYRGPGSNRGPGSDGEGAAALELRVRASGLEFAPVMASYVGDLVERFAGDAEPSDLLEELTFAVDEEITVLTRPDTLVPIVATSRRKITAANATTEEQLQDVERHRYEFTWDESKTATKKL